MPPISLPFTKFSVTNEFDDEAVLVDDDELLMEAADSGRCLDEGDALSLLSLDAVSGRFPESFGDCVGELADCWLLDKSFALEYDSFGEYVGLMSFTATLSSDLVNFKFELTASHVASSSLAESRWTLYLWRLAAFIVTSSLDTLLS